MWHCLGVLLFMLPFLTHTIRALMHQVPVCPPLLHPSPLHPCSHTNTELSPKTEYFLHLPSPTRHFVLHPPLCLNSATANRSITTDGFISLSFSLAPKPTTLALISLTQPSIYMLTNGAIAHWAKSAQKITSVPWSCVQRHLHPSKETWYLQVNVGLHLPHILQLQRLNVALLQRSHKTSIAVSRTFS